MLFINALTGPCPLFNLVTQYPWAHQSSNLSPDKTPDNPSSPSTGMDGRHPAAIMSPWQVQPHWWHAGSGKPGSPMHTGQKVHISRTQTSVEFHYDTARYLTNTVRCHYKAVNFIQNIHERHPISSPFRPRYGVSFESSASDWYPASVPAMMCEVSCYIIISWCNIGPVDYDQDMKVRLTIHKSSNIQQNWNWNWMLEPVIDIGGTTQ